MSIVHNNNINPYKTGLQIDLNCDMGEGMDNEADIMPFISSANISCGFHAGNSDSIKKTIELVDIVRIDHFRGFSGYWEIPASESWHSRFF